MKNRPPFTPKQGILASILLALFLLFVVPSTSAVICYQESANVSTACGGENTGAYALELAPGGNIGYFYINYTVPTNATSNTNYWQVNHGGLSTYNITLGGVCLKNPLRLRMVSTNDPWSISYVQCYTSIGWANIGNENSASDNGTLTTGNSTYLYDGNWSSCGTGATFFNQYATSGGYIKQNLCEEAMWWNITTNYTTPTNATSNITLVYYSERENIPITTEYYFFGMPSIQIYNENYSAAYDPDMAGNGTQIISSVPPGTYTIRLYRASPPEGPLTPFFVEKKLIVTVTENSSQIINTRMLLNCIEYGLYPYACDDFIYNWTSEIEYYVMDGENNYINGATITLMRQMPGGNFVVTDMRKTGIDGYGYFFMDEAEKDISGQAYVYSELAQPIYYWTISAPNFNTKSFYLSPYEIASPYTFKLTGIDTVLPYTIWNNVDYTIMPTNTTLQPVPTNFSLTAISSLGSLYRLGVTTYEDGYPSSYCYNPAGCIINREVDLSQYIGQSFRVNYTLIINNYSELVIPITYYVANENDTGFFGGNISLTGAINRAKANVMPHWMGIVFFMLIIISMVTVAQLSNGNSVPTTITGFVGLIAGAIFGILSPVLVGFIVLIGGTMFYFAREGM